MEPGSGWAAGRWGSHPPSPLLLYKCPVTSVPGPPPCEAPQACPPIPPGQGWPAASQPLCPATYPLWVCGGPGPTTPWTRRPESPTGGEGPPLSSTPHGPCRSGPCAGPLASAPPLAASAKSDHQLGRNEVTGGGGGAGDVCLERGGSVFRTHTSAGARAPHRPALPLWSGLFLFPGPAHLPSLPQSHPCLHKVSVVLGPGRGRGPGPGAGQPRKLPEQAAGPWSWGGW